MYPYLSSITIDNIDIKFIQQLNKHFELFNNHIKSINHNSNLIENILSKIRIDLHQRYQIRNNYYHRKYPLLLHDLCIIKSNKKYFQFNEKQHYQSIKFYKKLFNIQSLNNNIKQYHKKLEQSIKILNEFKNNIKQYENNIYQLKQELIKQNKQINFYSNHLFQIQFEQKQLNYDIKQLKQKILFEKQIFNEQKFMFNPKIILIIDEINSQKISLEKQQILKNQELQNIKDFNQNQLNQLHTEYNNLSTQITQIKFNIEQKSIDLLPLQFELYAYRTVSNMNETIFTESKSQPLLVPTTITNIEEINHQSASLINKFNENIIHPEQQQQLSIESINKSETKSLGPNLQSRLEALEAAMGVRLNVAKRQGRHSLSNTTSPSPMQLSPTSATTNTTISNSLSTSSRHNIPTRSGQGIQRSASSCDVENRPGPIKRLKPSLPNENSPSSSTINTIATIKKYPPPVRRPLLTTNLTPTRPTPIKQRSSPMDTSSPRLSRSSTTSNNSSSNSSNYRTPLSSISPKMTTSPSPKQIIINSVARPPITISRKQRLSIFGEQFSNDILKINLLWIDLKELDDECRSEVILQFGSIENFLREQNLFFTKQQQQLKLAAKNKTIVNRSRFQLLIPKKDRLELL